MPHILKCGECKMSEYKYKPKIVQWYEHIENEHEVSFGILVTLGLALLLTLLLIAASYITGLPLTSTASCCCY